jgi:hypothetical protein
MPFKYGSDPTGHITVSLLIVLSASSFNARHKRKISIVLCCRCGIPDIVLSGTALALFINITHDAVLFGLFASASLTPAVMPKNVFDGLQAVGVESDDAFYF